MKIKRLNIKTILIILHILFAMVGLYTYLATYRLSEDLLVQKTLNKQLVLAKAGSLAIENLMRQVQSELTSFVVSFAKIDEGAAIDKDSIRTAFTSYMQRSQLPVSGILLIDEKGQVVIVENRLHVRNGEGEDFSKAEFIKWSQNPDNKGRTFVSTPLLGVVGGSKGKIILIIAKPVYFGSRFKGILVVRLRVEDFTKAYITPLSFDSNEDTFVINSSGVVISGKELLLNKNLFDYAKKQKWPHYDDFINKLTMAVKKNEMQTSWIFQVPGEKPRDMLVGISKIDIPDTDNDLYLKVATPKDGILDSLSGLRRYGYFWLGVGVLTTIIGSLIIIKLQSSK